MRRPAVWGVFMGLLFFVLVFDLLLVVSRHEDALSPTRAREFVAALWPEDRTLDLLVAQAQVNVGEEEWRLHPEGMAARFVRDVMQWHSIARVEACGPGLNCPVAVQDSRTFAVAQKPDSDPVFVSLRQLAGQGPRGVWSVVTVQGPQLFLNLDPGATVSFSEPLLAQTSLRRFAAGDLMAGISSTTLPGGCFGGQAHRERITDGSIEFLAATSTFSCARGPTSASVGSAPGIPSEPAIGYVYIVRNPDTDSLHMAMDFDADRFTRRFFLEPGPIYDLAAVPVRFVP